MAHSIIFAKKIKIIGQHIDSDKMQASQAQVQRKKLCLIFTISCVEAS